MIVLAMEAVYLSEITTHNLSKSLYLVMSSLQEIMADCSAFHLLSFCRLLLYLLNDLGKNASRELEK